MTAIASQTRRQTLDPRRATGPQLASAMLIIGMLAATPVPAADATLGLYLVPNAGGHTATVNKVAFTPDGRALVSVSSDKTIRIWDVATGETLRVLRPPLGPGPEGMLYALAVSPDGKLLAVGGFESRRDGHGIYLIALADGVIVDVLRGHTNVIVDLAFSPDGRWLASASGDNTARLWNVSTRKSPIELRGHERSVYGLAFAPDGRTLVTAALDGTARVWSVPGGQSQSTLRSQHPVLCAAWSRDGEQIATGQADGSITLWDTAGTVKRRFEGLGNRVTSLGFTKSSTEVFYTLGGPGEYDGAYFIDLKTNAERLRFTAHNNSVLHGCLSPDGALAATAGGDNREILLWKPASGAIVHRLAGAGRTVWSAGWSPDGGTIAWGHTSRSVSPNDRGPLEKAFHVSDLALGAASVSAFERASTSGESGTLQPAGETAIRVASGTRTVATLKLADANDVVRSFSWLNPDAVAVGANHGLSIFHRQGGWQPVDLRGHTAAVWAVAPSPDGRFVLSASEDQTLRCWKVGHDLPLLSLFFTDTEWIAWTEAGYYAASPGGERLMGWHLNNGAEQMGTFFPAAQFRETLYRPDVIRLVLETGSVEAALALADEANGRPSAFARVEDVLPPHIKITAPDQFRTRVSDAQLEITAVAASRGSHPVTAMRVLLDGRPYEGQLGLKTFEEPKLGEVTATWMVELSPGKHRLAVQAESVASKAVSEEVEVSYAGGASVAPDELPALYVLAIGISGYEDASLRLNYASRDAQVFEQTVKSYSEPLFRRVETMLLVDGEATEREVKRGLAWFTQQMTERDVGVIFYSGHGDKDAQGIFYLLPADVDPSDISSTGIPEERIKTAVAGTPGRVLVLLDACHAGAIGGDQRKGALSITDDLVRDLLTDDYGTVVMCSSMGREFSLESNEHQQGYFTLALTEGLSGKADQNSDGAVYLHELEFYVTERIKDLTKGKQHPVTSRPTSIRSFPLAKP